MTRTLTLVSHTHWDREWYKPFQEFRIRLVQLVDRLLDLLEQDADYRHFMLDGQAIILEDYLEIRPEREADLRKHVQEGRLLVGPWYVLPDEFLVSPEATIRNLMLGDVVTRRFGPKMSLGYLPDCFGHISQMPQLLHGFGMDTAVVWRGVGQAPNEFLWVGPSGAEVLAVHLRGGYGNAAHLPEDPAAFLSHIALVAESLTPFAATPHLLAMNGTDHQEPQPRLSVLVDYAQAHLADLDLRHGTLPQFVAAVRSAGPVLEVRSGELRSPARAHLLPGVFSTRMWIKQRNARCETLLEKWAEPFSALAASHSLETPTRDLAVLCWCAWRNLIKNHPHDSICGCSVDTVHEEMEARFNWAEQIGEEVTRQSLSAIAGAVDIGPHAGHPVVVFNPTAGPRTDLVTVRVPLPVEAEAVGVCGPDGKTLLCEIVRHEQAPDSHLELRREEVLSALAALSGDSMVHEGALDVTISVDGDAVSIDTLLGPLPPSVQVLESSMSKLRELVANPSLRQFHLRLHRMAEMGVRFVAPDVPGHGYKTFFISPSPPTVPPAARPRAMRLENDHFMVEADPGSGTLSVTDKVSGSHFPFLHRFVDGGDRGDEYNYCVPEKDRLVTSPAEPASIRLTADSPVCQTLEIAQRYLIPASLGADRSFRSTEMVSLPITTRVSLCAGVPRIDFVTTLENFAEDHRLRLHFATPISTDVCHSEGHFDLMTRPLTAPQDTQDWPEQPVPTHHQRTFVAVTDGQSGLLLANKGLPEVEVMQGREGTAIALTLLRCVGWLSRDDMHCRRNHAGPGYSTPGAQCLGNHVFEYALIPYSGDWVNACHQAHAFNAPLRAVSAPKTGGTLPLSLSLASAKPHGFVLTAIKLPENGHGLVVRGFNITDAPLEVELRLGRIWRRARRARLDEICGEELPIVGNLVRFDAGPKEIVTLRFADHQGD
jgi:mannosylglycerate hydrolase